jgi:hypothetical protein
LIFWRYEASLKGSVEVEVIFCSLMFNFHVLNVYFLSWNASYLFPLIINYL